MFRRSLLIMSNSGSPNKALYRPRKKRKIDPTIPRTNLKAAQNDARASSMAYNPTDEQLREAMEQERGEASNQYNYPVNTGLSNSFATSTPRLPVPRNPAITLDEVTAHAISSINPELASVHAVGHNGLNFDQDLPPLVQPNDFSQIDPDGPEPLAIWRDNIKTPQNPQHHLFLGKRLLAYASTHDIFDLDHPDSRARCAATEFLWTQNRAASNLETAFWNGCAERQRNPHLFDQRDGYLELETAVEFMGFLIEGVSVEEGYERGCQRVLDIMGGG